MSSSTSASQEPPRGQAKVPAVPDAVILLAVEANGDPLTLPWDPSRVAYFACRLEGDAPLHVGDRLRLVARDPLNAAFADGVVLRRWGVQIARWEPCLLSEFLSLRPALGGMTMLMTAGLLEALQEGRPAPVPPATVCVVTGDGSGAAVPWAAPANA